MKFSIQEEGKRKTNIFNIQRSKRTNWNPNLQHLESSQKRKQKIQKERWKSFFHSGRRDK